MEGGCLTREEIASLARITGVCFEGEALEELIESWRLIEPALARLPRRRPRADEPAHVFDPRKFMAQRETIVK